MKQRLDIVGVLKGDYSTPEIRIRRAAAYFSCAVFYLLMAREVWKASRTGRRGLLTSEDYYRHGVNVFRAVEKVGGRIEIRGLEALASAQGPFVYVANHMSVLETFILAVMLHPLGEHTFVVKKSLVDYPVFRHVMRAMDPIVVGRENPREDLEIVLRCGTEKLQQGLSVVVFPQRTRTAEFVPEKFNTIGIKLAKRAGVPVVPIALKTDFWGQGRLIKDFGGIFPQKTVRFQFGAPVAVTGNGRLEHEQIVRFIGEAYAAWERLDR